MPFGAMAQARPCFLSAAHSSTGTSSTEGQPSFFATSQILSRLHFSPAALKHQKAIDCLMRPLREVFSSAGNSDGVAARAEAAAPWSRRRRLSESLDLLMVDPLWAMSPQSTENPAI